jgi:hypothetical protein
VISGLLMTSAAAQITQPVDKRTVFTFSGPVSMPGVTLPAGEYVFRLADADSTRKVIQVQNKEGRSLGMFFSIPIDRPEADSDPEIGFIETASGLPAAVRSWWYAGDRSGYEFIYPKDQARRLAAGSSEPVLTTKADSTAADQTNTSELTRVTPSGSETAVAADARPAPAAQSQSAQNAPADDRASDMNRSTDTRPARTSVGTSGSQEAPGARTRLPQTATPLPFVWMVGACCSIAAAGLWVRRTAKRHARVGRS